MAGLFGGRGRAVESDRVGIDPVACDGIGMCAHLAPGVISVDGWGYPMLPVEPISGRDLRAARAAAAACPRRALFLDGDPLLPRVAPGRRSEGAGSHRRKG
jgi:ferredoxin